MIYLASGWFNKEQKEKMELVLKKLRDSGFDVFAPYESKFNNEEIDNRVAQLICEDDIKHIHECDVIVSIYDEQDSGTMWELGYAYAINKHIVTITSETFMNLMISQTVDGIYHSFEQFLDAEFNDEMDIIEHADKEWEGDSF